MLVTKYLKMSCSEPTVTSENVKYPVDISRKFSGDLKRIVTSFRPRFSIISYIFLLMRELVCLDNRNVVLPQIQKQTKRLLYKNEFRSSIVEEQKQVNHPGVGGSKMIGKFIVGVRVPSLTKIQGLCCTFCRHILNNKPA